MQHSRSVPALNGEISMMNARILRTLILAALAVSVALTPLAAKEDGESVLTLAIGDPARKDQQVELVLDGITDTRTGEVIVPSDLAAKVEDARLLLVGETHTNIDFHNVQLRIIEELHRAGRKVMIGLEMYPYTEQEYLDQWSRNLLTEEGFLEISEWYKNWGYPWKYYREIFLFARDNGLKIYALNTPREVVRAVRQKGFDELTDEQRAHIPEEIDTDSDEHIKMFKAIFEEDADSDFHAQLPEPALRSMFNAQCTWDAAMGFKSVKALREHDDPKAILVVMVGAGHLAYDLGIERQVKQWYDGRVASVIPISVGDICKPVEKVQASYADFIWGVPPEVDPIYPALGISTAEDKKSGLRKVIYVSKDSPGKNAGIKMGDRLLTMDGVEIKDRATIMSMVAAKRWGDSAEIVVSRGDEKVEILVNFRRTRPEPCEEEDDETEGGEQ
jgi:uncharacterized iron-regulated protein